MKKILIFGNVFLLLFCFFSLNGYAQTRNKAAVLGTVTIDEKGQVTVQSFGEQEKKPANVPSQTGKFPQIFNDLPEGVKSVVKTMTSGADQVLNDMSSGKPGSGVPQETRSITSKETDLLRFENPDLTGQLKNTGVTGASSREGNSGLNDVQKIYEANREKPLTSSPCELLSTDKCILVRWYGEKEYFISPSTNNIREYQERIGVTGRDQENTRKDKFHIVNISVTPAVKEMLRSIDIFVPEFMNDQVKISIPECDFRFLQDQNIGFTIDELYGTQLSETSGESADLKSVSATASTLYSEGFEGSFPGTDYTVNDNNTTAGLDMWDDVSCDKHGGSWSIWCAANGDKPDCSTYDNSMISWVMKNSLISLSGYTDVNFTFWMKYAMESTNDVLKYWAHNGTTWSMIIQYTGSYATWAQYTFSLLNFPSFRWEFDFISNETNSGYQGAFLDDMAVTGTPLEPNLDLASGTGTLTVTGTNVSVGLTVVNNGTATAGASELGYYLSPDLNLTTTPNYLIGTDAVASLAISGTSAQSLSVDVSAMSIPCGTYYVFFSIDHLNQVTESSETDNVWYWSTPSVVIPCVPNLDLASGTATLSVTGTNINMAITTINNGSTTAAASQLGYYLSPDANFTTTPNYLIGTDAVPSLAVGATSAQTLVVDVSQSSIPCGTYYVFFVFDHLGQVTESNELDNIWYFSSPIVTIPCVPNLDLASGTGSLTVTGTSVSIALSVINNGSTTAGTSELGYYISPDNSFTTTPNYLIGTDAVPSLAVGGTSAQTYTVNVLNITPLIPCGTYYVFFYIDRLGQVSESNENDNIWYFTNPLVTVPSLTNLTYQSGSGSLTVSGTTVTLGYTVINNGNCPSVACSSGYYLSSDNSLTTTPNYFIGYTSIPALAAGGTSVQTLTKDVLTVSPPIPAGTYYVFFFMDYLGAVAESNENDNAWYYTSPQVTITQQPDVKILGNTDVYSLSSTTANRRAQTVTFPEAGTIQSISIYHNGGTGHVLLGIYSDASGSPAARLGVTSSTTINASAGWQTIPLTTPLEVSSGQKIWLSWVFENNPGVRYVAGTPARAQSEAVWSGGMPDPFGTAAFANYKYSLYCSYTTGEEPETKNLGNTEVYGSTSATANRRAQTVTFPEAGTIQSISIYHNGGSGQVLLGVYADAGGSPGARIGVTPSTTVNAAAGWQTISLSSPAGVTSGQKVWLAWVFQTNPGIRYITGTPARAESPQLWAGGMPDPFGTASFANYKYSLYCSYTPGEEPETKNLGNTEVYGSTSTTANRRAQTVTFPEAGTIQSLSIYHNGGSGQILLGVYSDAGGSPGARIGITPSTTVNAAAGWQTVLLSSPVGVTSGQKVWLAWVFQTNPGIRYIAGTPARAESPQIWAGGIPDPFGTSTLANYKYSLYCTYTTGGGPETKTLGNTEVYSLSSTTANRRAQTVTFPEAGTIQSLSIYHNGGTGHVLLGIYSDGSGSPAARLGVTPSTTINASAGWQTIPLTTPLAVSSGQKIWLSWVFENNPGVRYIAGTPARAQSEAVWAGGMPDPFGTSTFANYKYSLYCTYLTSSGDEIKYTEETKSVNIPLDVNSVYMDKEEVTIYPNPTDGEITVTWKNRYPNRLDITIFNIVGKAVKQVQAEPDVNEIRLDINNHSDGLYLLEMKDRKNNLILNRSRIIKK